MRVVVSGGRAVYGLLSRVNTLIGNVGILSKSNGNLIKAFCCCDDALVVCMPVALWIFFHEGRLDYFHKGYKTFPSRTMGGCLKTEAVNQQG